MRGKFLNDRVALHCGDSREVLRRIHTCIDSIVTDPPYALASIQKRFGKPNSAPAKGNGAYARASAGFMGKQWDTGETAFAAEFWAECLRVLKPGGHVVAFGGTRTYHRMVVAIEDAGLEIRDQLAWVYGSGFPKSRNIGNGWGTALKPAWEPIVLARKPLIGTVAANVLEHGTGAINVDGCRVPITGADARDVGRQFTRNVHEGDDWGMNGETAEYGVTHLRADGRWPANIVHDGSEEVLAAFPDVQSGYSDGTKNGIQRDVFGKYGAGKFAETYGDSGSAARFFYSAKADAHDRIGSKHPTVKPVNLMQWLVRLVTPKGGLVLDPFAGTGSTGEAALREGMRCILIEREEEYQADIRRRMALAMAGPDERARESIKARRGGELNDAGPLFAGSETPPAWEGKSTESSRTNNRADGIEMVNK